MAIFLQIFILFILLVILVQDLKHRAVYWFVFPVLTISFYYLRYIRHPEPAVDMIKSILICTGFLFIQLLALTLFVSVRRKQFVNITKGSIALGDILFLSCVCFYLPLLNFVLFYVLSLCATLLIWSIYTALSKRRDKQVPLAGLQSAVLFVVLGCAWYLQVADLTTDDWIWRLVS